MDKTGIVNAALLLIGAKKIDSISSSGTKSARLANTIYEHCRDIIFSMPINWKFATTRAELSALSDDPAFGSYDHQYALPDDCVRIIAMVDEDGDDKEYVHRKEVYISGSDQYDVILTNEDDVYVKYIVMRNDPAKYPAWFTQLIVLKLAFFLVEPLKQDDRLYIKLKDMWTDALNDAKAGNGTEDVDVDDNDTRLDYGNKDVIDAAVTEIESETDKRIVERT